MKPYTCIDHLGNIAYEFSVPKELVVYHYDDSKAISNCLRQLDQGEGVAGTTSMRR
jgi:hypothetical protein